MSRLAARLHAVREDTATAGTCFPGPLPKEVRYRAGTPSGASRAGWVSRLCLMWSVVRGGTLMGVCARARRWCFSLRPVTGQDGPSLRCSEAPTTGGDRPRAPPRFEWCPVRGRRGAFGRTEGVPYPFWRCEVEGGEGRNRRHTVGPDRPLPKRPRGRRPARCGARSADRDPPAVPVVHDVTAH